MSTMAVEHHDASVTQLPTTRNDTGVADALQALEIAAAELRAALDEHVARGGQLSTQLTVLGERAVALARGAHFQRTGRLV